MLTILTSGWISLSILAAAAAPGGAAPGGGAPAGAPTPKPDWGNMLFYMFVLFGLFYLLLIRPQKKREAERREMLSKIKEKDRVVTIGGIHGQIVSLNDNAVTLRIDARKDVQIRVARSSVSAVAGSEAGDDHPSEPLQADR